MIASRPRRTPRGFTLEDDALITQLHGQGWSADRIARAIRRNPSSVHARGAALGLAWRGRKSEPRTRVARPNPRRRRACLTCARPFLSDGPGNRMCGDCRVAATDVSPFEP